MNRRTVDLIADLRNVAVARRFVAGALDDWSLASDAVTLVTSELVANAIEHASKEVTVAIQRSRHGVRLEVSDGSPALPMIRELDRTSVRGRGLGIVEILATDWGTHLEPDGGKTIWAEFDA